MERNWNETAARDRIGSVEHVYVTPETGGAPVSKTEVEAVAGRGLRGDRYFEGKGLYNVNDRLPDAADVTLIEVEALEHAADQYDVDLRSGGHRRNVTTRDVALNHLLDEQFRVGDVLLEGEMSCEPCGYMQHQSGEAGAAGALDHRGGLRARIVESGTIAEDDEVVW